MRIIHSAIITLDVLTWPSYVQKLRSTVRMTMVSILDDHDDDRSLRLAEPFLCVFWWSDCCCSGIRLASTTMDPATKLEEQKPEYEEEEGGDYREFDSPSDEINEDPLDDNETQPMISHATEDTSSPIDHICKTKVKGMPHVVI